MKNNYNIILFYIMPQGNPLTRNGKGRKAIRNKNKTRKGKQPPRYASLNPKPQSSKLLTNYARLIRKNSGSKAVGPRKPTYALAGTRRNPTYALAGTRRNPTYAEVGSRRNPTYEEVGSRRNPTYVEVKSREPTYAEVKSREPTYAEVKSREPTYAEVGPPKKEHIYETYHNTKSMGDDSITDRDAGIKTQYEFIEPRLSQKSKISKRAKELKLNK